MARKHCGKGRNWVENTVGKGEIALYEQFLLFRQCFQKACYPGASKGVIVWEWVNLTCTVLLQSMIFFLFMSYHKQPTSNLFI